MRLACNCSGAEKYNYVFDVVLIQFLISFQLSLQFCASNCVLVNELVLQSILTNCTMTASKQTVDMAEYTQTSYFFPLFSTYMISIN